MASVARRSIDVQPPSTRLLSPPRTLLVLPYLSLSLSLSLLRLCTLSSHLSTHPWLHLACNTADRDGKRVCGSREAFLRKRGIGQSLFKDNTWDAFLLVLNFGNNRSEKQSYEIGSETDIVRSYLLSNYTKCILFSLNYTTRDRNTDVFGKLQQPRAKRN